MGKRNTNEVMRTIQLMLEEDRDWPALAIKYGYANGKSLKEQYRVWNKKNPLQDTPVLSGKGVTTDILKVEIKKDIEKGITLKAICNKYEIGSSLASTIISSLLDDGVNIVQTKDILHIGKYVVAGENTISKQWDGIKVIKFGIVSDTHFGSNYQQLTLLNKMYDLFTDLEIPNVYHSGDISEGIKMRPGHEQECFLHGSDDIENYIIANYPKRAGILTNFITGNHDHSMIKSAGHDIGVKIAKERDDMIYLGMANAKVYLTPNCIMELNHPLDGAAYALSYSIQKLADSLSGGEKPNILINGHHHKALYLFYRNMHMLEAGCFEAQTPWMKGKRISAHVGGFIVTIHVTDDGEITRFLPEFVPFYEMVKNDYKN